MSSHLMVSVSVFPDVSQCMRSVFMMFTGGSQCFAHVSLVV